MSSAALWPQKQTHRHMSKEIYAYLANHEMDFD